MKFLRLAASGLILLLAAGDVAAEALLKPLPQPDLSKLDKASAESLQSDREDFETAKRGLVGPPLAETYAQIAVSYARAGFVEIAQIAMANAAELAEPTDGRWIYLQGVLAQGHQAKPVVRDYFERAFARDSNYLPIRTALVATLIDAGELERARKLVDEAIATAKDQPRLYEQRGVIALKQHRNADAVGALEQATKLDPNASLAFGELADAYIAQGNSAAASSARAKAGTVPTRITDLLAAGVLTGGALTAATGNVAGGTASNEPADPLSQAAFFIGVHQYTAARKQLDEALKLSPDDAALNALYARVDAMAGNAAAANSRIDAALRRTPGNALLLLTRAVVAEISGNEAAARADYQRAVAADAKLAEARQLLANNLLRAGQAAQAVEQYRQLLQLAPGLPETHGRLAAAEAIAGHCTQALRDIDTALRGHPRQALLTQIFVRLASTCPGTSEAERGMALDYAKRLYKQLPTPANTEALALAVAAAGRYDDAVQLQGGAVFMALRDGGDAAAAQYQEFFKRFEAKQLPNRPWPSVHSYFQPAPLRAEPEAPAGR